ALDKDGNPVDFADITVDDSQMDPSKVGTYEVTYTYEGVTSTATITVKEKQTAVNVHDSTIYVGDEWQAKDNFDSALDKDGNPVDFADITVDDSQMDPSKVGTYEVTYTYEGVTSTAIITVKYKKGSNEEKSTVIVQYIDENGNKISEDKVLKGQKGEHYKTKAKKIDGYTLKKTPKNSEGQFSDEEVTVVYTYAKEEIEIDNSKSNTEAKSNSSGNSQKVFPKTGEEQSNLGLLFGVGLILLGGVVFTLRHRRNN
ncbi:LPXTG cell wall anchor domain-containing protein, partial [Enterococcus casseliflavus]|nr:LPXTG cell wall anchor domain-containing protein [Enterococcus casseliflavus]